MDEKLKFIARYLEGESITKLCQEFGVSRTTGHNLITRYRQMGGLLGSAGEAAEFLLF